MNIEDRLERAPVVPLIQADDPAIAVQIANALVAGGVAVVAVLAGWYGSAISVGGEEFVRKQIIEENIAYITSAASRSKRASSANRPPVAKTQRVGMGDLDEKSILLSGTDADGDTGRLRGQRAGDPDTLFLAA